MKRIYGLMFLILLLLLTGCGKSTEEKWQEQYDLGMQYLTEGDYEAAIVAFTAAIEIDPNRTPAYIGRGDSYVLSGTTEENLTLAQTDYETVLELDETVQEAYLGLSDISVLREDYDGALDMLKTGLEKAEETEQILERIPETLQEYYVLALKCLEEEDYEIAIEMLTKIIDFITDLDIDDETLRKLLVDAYISRGDSYAKSGDTEENLALAMADYLAALELDETAAKAYLGIADVYIRQGDYDSALEILQEGLEKADSTVEIEDKIEEIEAGNITDSSGNIRRQTSYDGDGALLWYHEYTYQSDGSRESVTSYDSSGNQTGHIDMEYDDYDRTIVSYYYRTESGEVGRIEILYDDDSDYCNQAIWYDLDGALDRVYIYEWDSEGNEISVECYDSDGELDYTEYYEYNDLGQQVKSTVVYSGGYESYYLYEYDTDGNPIRYSYYSNGELTRIHENVYDDEGNYQGYRIYDGDGNLIQSVINE